MSKVGTDSSLRSRSSAPEVAVTARTYCGDLHGRRWLLPDETPPDAVLLTHGEATLRYRLVRVQRTGRPARDYGGNYVYVPASHSGL